MRRMAMGAVALVVVGCSQSLPLGQSDQWGVVRVVEDEMLLIVQGQKEETIRLCGLRLTQQAEAQRRLEAWLMPPEGPIMVAFTGRDQTDRQTAEVFVELEQGDRFIQEELLRMGLATIEPETIGLCPNGEQMKEVAEMAQTQ